MGHMWLFELCMQLFELFKKLYIFYFLYVLQSVEILQNGTVVVSVLHSVTRASCSKKNIMSQKCRMQTNSCF